MIQLCGVDRWLFLRVYGLHQVDFHLKGPHPHRADVLINVFTLALEVTRDLQPQHVDPQAPQALLIRPANSDLLYA